MKNKKITVSINGRDALPVRAIPHVTGGLLSPHELAQKLAQKSQKRLGELPNLMAYQLVDGESIQVMPKEWDVVEARLDDLEADLRSQYANNTQGYAAWLSKSLMLLPEGVFVWWDEFENDFLDVFSEERVSFTDERQGERAVSCTPMMSDEERALVLVGFEPQQTSVEDPDTIANDEGTAAFAEAMRNGEPVDWQYWADRKNITPQQAAKLAHCIDPLRWPSDQFGQGQIPDELRIKIQRLSEWLDEREQAWPLPNLVKTLGDGLAPFLMKLVVQFAQQIEDKQNTGRFTLHEAAVMLQQHAGERASDMLKKLIQAVEAGVLPVHEPGKQALYQSKTVRDNHEEVYWDDLNKWLIGNEPRITYRFSEPRPSVEAQLEGETGQPRSSPNDWREAARLIADECFDRDTDNSCRDSLNGYSGRVMDEMQNRKIHGPRGLIDNHKTIQREALQGGKWWANKVK